MAVFIKGNMCRSIILNGKPCAGHLRPFCTPRNGGTGNDFIHAILSKMHTKYFKNVFGSQSISMYLPTYLFYKHFIIYEQLAPDHSFWWESSLSKKLGAQTCRMIYYLYSNIFHYGKYPGLTSTFQIYDGNKVYKLNIEKSESILLFSERS